MPEAPCVGRVLDYGMYELPNQRLAVVQHGIPRRQGPHCIDWTSELAALIRSGLCSRNRLFSAGGSPVLVIDGKPTVVQKSEAAWELLHRAVFFGVQDEVEVANSVNVPTHALQDMAPADLWQACCSHTLRRTSLSRSDTRFAGAIAAHEEVVPWGGVLKHPVFGELPPGWFGIEAPRATKDYKRLRELYSPLPLDPASHARLYMYLLGAFHATSLTAPSPLLVVDSWVQGVGKTECCGAVSELVNGERANLSPPTGAQGTDEIVAFFNAGHRMACFDNLVTSRPYNSPWLCALLTDRTASARAKYDAKTTTFGGRLASLTMVYGDAVLHPDLISRAWRVMLWGNKGRKLKHRPNAYAAKHQSKLRSESYTALSKSEGLVPRVLEAIAHVSGRCEEVAAIGGAAYCEVFGIKPADLAARLETGANDALGLSSAAARFLTSEGIRVGTSALAHVGTVSKPERIVLDKARALGYNLICEDKPRAERIEHEAITKRASTGSSDLPEM